MSGLVFHALNLIILSHNPIHPELIRGSLGEFLFNRRYLKLTILLSFRPPSRNPFILFLVRKLAGLQVASFVDKSVY